MFAGEISDHAQAGEDTPSRSPQSPLVATHWALLQPGPPCLSVILLLSPIHPGLALGSCCLILPFKGIVLQPREPFPCQVTGYCPSEFPTSNGREQLYLGVSCCEPCSSSHVQYHCVLSITSCVGGRRGIYPGLQVSEGWFDHPASLTEHKT